MIFDVIYKCRSCEMKFIADTITTDIPMVMLQHSLDKNPMAIQRVPLAITHACQEEDYDPRIGVADLIGLSRIDKPDPELDKEAVLVSGGPDLRLV